MASSNREDRAEITFNSLMKWLLGIATALIISLLTAITVIGAKSREQLIELRSAQQVMNVNFDRRLSAVENLVDHVSQRLANHMDKQGG